LQHPTSNINQAITQDVSSKNDPSKMKRTVVLGASPNPARISNGAVVKLVNQGYEVIPIGNRQGQIAGLDILTGTPQLEEVHTVTLYLNPQRQIQYYDYILNMEPERIIFNPGTENAELVKLAKEKRNRDGVCLHAGDAGFR
jgi:predicted CoA-binding protein